MISKENFDQFTVSLSDQETISTLVKPAKGYEETKIVDSSSAQKVMNKISSGFGNWNSKKDSNLIRNDKNVVSDMELHDKDVVSDMERHDKDVVSDMERHDMDVTDNTDENGKDVVDNMDPNQRRTWDLFSKYLGCDNGYLVITRTLTFCNIIIGDENLQYVSPGTFDRNKKTYVKTIKNATIGSIISFFVETQLQLTQRVMIHAGSYEINILQVPIEQLVSELYFLMSLIRLTVPKCEIYLSLQFPVFESEESKKYTTSFNKEILALQSREYAIFAIRHEKIFALHHNCFQADNLLTMIKGTRMFLSSVKYSMGLHETITTSRSSEGATDDGARPDYSKITTMGRSRGNYPAYRPQPWQRNRPTTPETKQVALVHSSQQTD